MPLSRQPSDSVMPHRVAYTCLATREIRAFQFFCQSRHFIIVEDFSKDGESVCENSLRGVLRSFGYAHLTETLVKNLG